MKFLKIVLQKVGAVAMVLIKFCLFMALMLAGAWALAPMGKIHSKDIDLSQFNNHPNEMMMNFFQTEFFSGYLFSVTLAVVLAAIYGMWQVHELGVHKAKEHKSAHVQIVFALSLCGLFISKTFWVIALVIALANWKHIGQSISDVIRRGIQPKSSENESFQSENSSKASDEHKVNNEQAAIDEQATEKATSEQAPTKHEAA
ncbi:magnesium transporter [Vibrio sp. Isolate33]|uniref:magnesium transporter n=1 Tax=Vibrio sp. Isolate33 TaxID=2908539 RepID=UPI001EFDCD18|nr:magnesium transporter [Vibrio sp. Isolate33]MCG9543080.1 magnesium transporter [Vibrio sp. Isolate33]